ncbi:prephenate dehydrogenase [Salinibacillus xinjiangensis]|uniref:Prephenate dehydrogenase n=1 Tax=Salinibacillus xinjiangensis TaxID=1229268 RepID=A0A6G1X6F5_9BACI|nr:prephenate dehydrogenase [Salinibacillus xinjiangensis]MRG86398.1 prephenate dehydrogenase [Salinibacillus xinjiangensis]
MSRVFIVGLGLIGASLVKNIKFNQPNSYIYGLDLNAETIERALKYNIIDESVDSFEEGVQKADVVILGTPIHITIDYINQLQTIPVTTEKIVTDVSSVKGSIMKVAKQIENPNIKFIGGHPMAGSHKQGIEAAKSHLFENAYYILIPARDGFESQIAILKELLKNTKSYFVELTEKEHDKMTGIVSHFPHLIASSLVHQARNWQDEYPFLPQLAAGGFRDITRIASSNPDLWQDILFQNKTEMVQFLDEWIEEMDKVKGLLETDQRGDVREYLDRAKIYRDGLPKKKKGALPNFYDIYVDIFDQPGELYKVIKRLAEYELNITNIQILEIRENMTGVLRLTMQTEEEQLAAMKVLESHQYEVSLEE